MYKGYNQRKKLNNLSQNSPILDHINNFSRGIINLFEQKTPKEQQYQKIINDLKMEVDQLKRSLREKQSEMINKFNEEKVKIHENFHMQFNSMCQILTNQKNAFFNQLKNKNENIVKINQNYIRLTMDYDKIAKKQQQAEKKMIESQQRLNQKLQQNEAFLNNIQKMKRNELKICQELRQSHKKIDELRIENNRLGQLINTKEGQKNTFARQLSSSEQRIRKIQQELYEKNQERKRLNQERQSDLFKISQLKQEIQQLRIQKANLQKNFRTNNHIQSCQKGLQEIDNRNQNSPSEQKGSQSNESKLRGNLYKSQKLSQQREKCVQKQNENQYRRRYIVLGTKIKCQEGNIQIRKL